MVGAPILQPATGTKHRRRPAAAAALPEIDVTDYKIFLLKYCLHFRASAFFPVDSSLLGKRYVFPLSH